MFYGGYGYDDHGSVSKSKKDDQYAAIKSDKKNNVYNFRACLVGRVDDDIG